MKTNTDRKKKNYKQHSYGAFDGIYLRYLHRLQWARSNRKAGIEGVYSTYDNMNLMVYLIASGVPLSSEDLARLLQVHRNTINNYITVLWRDYDVSIKWKVLSRKVGNGKFILSDWGMLTPDRTIAHVIKSYGLKEVHKALNMVREQEGMEPLTY